MKELIAGEIYFFEDYPLHGKFKFPQEYIDLIRGNDVPDIDPYFWLAPYKDLSISWADILKKQFPERKLVPFAKDAGSDDIFCFDGEDPSGSPKVLIIHSFCDPGWEYRGEFQNFLKWVEHARLHALEYIQDLDAED